MIDVLFGLLLLTGTYLATGCAVAAGSWSSVRRRHTVYPTTRAGVCWLVTESARWPLTVKGM